MGKVTKEKQPKKLILFNILDITEKGSGICFITTFTPELEVMFDKKPGAIHFGNDTIVKIVHHLSLIIKSAG